MLALHWQGSCLLPNFFAHPTALGFRQPLPLHSPIANKKGSSCLANRPRPDASNSPLEGRFPLLLAANTYTARTISHRIASHRIRRCSSSAPASHPQHLPSRTCPAGGAACLALESSPDSPAHNFQNHRRLGRANLLLISDLSLGLCLCCVVVWLCAAAVQFQLRLCHSHRRVILGDTACDSQSNFVQEAEPTGASRYLIGRRKGIEPA